MKECFDEFIKKYDMNIPKLNYKYYHSYRVMDTIELLAKNQKMPPEDIELAKCIGLFHDIGRFIQYNALKDFDDLQLDHGDIGSDYVKKQNLLSKCPISKENYQIVYKAIKNHNKFTLDKSLNPREAFYSGLIRDADKLDILYAMGNKKIKPTIIEDDCPITENVKNTFFAGKPVTKSAAKNKNDKIIIVFSFIFDIYLDKTYEIIKTNDYYNQIYKRLKNQDIFTPYIEYINKYITERTDKNVRKKI